MEQSFSDLFKMDKCSPLMAYGVIVIITAICIYNVRSEFNRVGNNPKIKNINQCGFRIVPQLQINSFNRLDVKAFQRFCRKTMTEFINRSQQSD